MANSSFKMSEFVDILEERRGTSDLRWALKKWDVTPCRFSMKRTPQDIKEEILSCDKIKQVIHEISQELKCPEEEIEDKARIIVDEMSHNIQFKVIRFFGYILSKFMKSVYGKIFVNKKEVEKLGKISSQYPIIYLPMHRSYSDFLLVSYACFYFNLPVPVIAAGLDFLGLKYLSFLLRGAGAFFIRRSFVGDRLYKEIFSQYVQTHIEGGEFPLEFFIEGTRSRTAKSLVPKLGMLQVILDMFFSSKVPDITVVPISISYDRTLEESLYAFELLGVPKPRESTRGLIKARKVMSDYFGNVCVVFGEPISLKDFFKGYDRSIHNLHPRNYPFVIKEEQVLCRDLANHVIRMHQRNILLSPFPLVCVVLSQFHASRGGGLHFNLLVDYVYWLEELVRRNGGTMHTDNLSLPQSIAEQLKLHSNIIQVSESVYVSYKEIDFDQSHIEIPRLKDKTVVDAIPAMFSTHYGSQALQLLVHLSMVCLSALCGDGDTHQHGDILYRYNVLRKVLQREFVFERLTSEKDFNATLDSLIKDNIFSTNGEKIIIHCSEKMEFLASLILPFLESYRVICQHLLQSDSEIHLDTKKLSLELQSQIEHAILEGLVTDYRCLSLDMINNCISFLVSQGGLTILSENGSAQILPSHSDILNALLDLEMFLPVASKEAKVSNRIPFPAAKL